MLTSAIRGEQYLPLILLSGSCKQAERVPPGRAPEPVCMPAAMKPCYLDMVRGVPEWEQYSRDLRNQQILLARGRGLPDDYCAKQQPPEKECEK